MDLPNETLNVIFCNLRWIRNGLKRRFLISIVERLDAARTILLKEDKLFLEGLRIFRADIKKEEKKQDYDEEERRVRITGKGKVGLGDEKSVKASIGKELKLSLIVTNQEKGNLWNFK